jgi:5'-3' exonuclease
MPILIIDGNLLARKSYYKFNKLTSAVNQDELTSLSKILGNKVAEEKELRASSIKAQEAKIEETYSEESGNKVSYKLEGRIERGIDKHFVANERFKIPTGTLYGMLRSILTAFEKYKVTKVIICYDPLQKPKTKDDRQFRLKKAADYKNRKKDPNHEMRFFASLDLAVSFFYKIGITQITTTAWEADDLIHYLTHVKYKKKKCLVLTNDHDMFQILEPNRVSMLRIGTANPLYTAANFRKEHGLPPKRYLDVLTLAGCSTDNVKGIPGVGEITALLLLKKFKTIEKMAKEYKSSNIDKRIKTALKEEENVKWKNMKKSHMLVRLYGTDKRIKEGLKTAKSTSKPEKQIKNAEIFLKTIQFKSFMLKSARKSIKAMINAQ